MAAELVPANQRVSKLFQSIQRYDIDDLLVAATRMTWPVISRDEKRGIEKQGGSKREKLDRLISLVIKSADRTTQFAEFIKWYTSPIQEAVDAVLECQDSLAAHSVKTIADHDHESENLMVTNSRVQMQNAKLVTPEADQRSQKPSFSGSSSTARRTIQFVDTGTVNSQEQYSMEIRDNLMGSQVNNLSSGSQKLSDIGYSSGLSKDFQSPNLPAGGAEFTSLSTLRSNLEVSKRHHQSRQLKKQQRRLDATKHQHITHFHQPVVVHHHYHVPRKDEQQMRYDNDDQWPPLLARHSRDIIKSLKMEMLVPHLVEKNLLTKNEYQELTTYSPWKQGEHFVLKILPTKGEDGCKRFLECLEEEEEHSGHQDLFRLLENTKVKV